MYRSPGQRPERHMQLHTHENDTELRTLHRIAPIRMLPKRVSLAIALIALVKDHCGMLDLTGEHCLSCSMQLIACMSASLRGVPCLSQTDAERCLSPQKIVDALLQSCYYLALRRFPCSACESLPVQEWSALAHCRPYLQTRQGLSHK